MEIFSRSSPGDDGSILAVIGDVSGKGMQAAMLVSLIVGTLRTYAEKTRDPLQILEGLNRRLCGRLEHQFATCIVAHIAADGTTQIVNAGHLPPYLNGEEIVTSGSLPLGIIPEPDFERSHLTLAPGDTITLLTDGIIEAKNAQKELFGFARTREMLKQVRPACRNSYRRPAVRPGRRITIIAITRNAAPVKAPAPALELAST